MGSGARWAHQPKNHAGSQLFRINFVVFRCLRVNDSHFCRSKRRKVRAVHVTAVHFLTVARAVGFLRARSGFHQSMLLAAVVLIQADLVIDVVSSHGLLRKQRQKGKRKRDIDCHYESYPLDLLHVHRPYVTENCDEVKTSPITLRLWIRCILCINTTGAICCKGHNIIGIPTFAHFHSG